MKQTRLLLAVVALGGLAAVAAACGDSSTADSDSAAGGAVARPTRSPSGSMADWKHALTHSATNLEDAASFARDMLDSRPPFVREVDPDSLEYVVATVGDARDVLDPTRDGKLWDTPDDVPAVIFVAKGEFRMTPPVALNLPTYTVTRVWVVIPLGISDPHMTPYDKDFDLSQLGEVHQVPLPLAPFPTPVSLGTPEVDAE